MSDGIYGMVERSKMSSEAAKMRDFYEMKKDAPIVQEEFWLYALDKWKEEGLIKNDENTDQLFGFDAPGKRFIHQLGWCEAAFDPIFEEKVLEDRGDHELVQDFAGRHVLYFKNRRVGFMPEYIDHPVKDQYTWEKNVKWRLDPNSAGRYANTKVLMEQAVADAKKGLVIGQNLIGGYMYLRSLLGPEGALYMFYDDPDLIHDCMKTWFELSDTVIAKHQEFVTLDELFFAEDISYNNGPLISPDMIREFLFPYYQQLITNTKKRQLDKSRHLYIQLDTDGDCKPLIPVYKEIGMDYISPCEVASGCDVVEIRKQHPDIRIRGGIDKRILATSKDAIDKELERIIPFMREQGGYIPTCDHCVPNEVSLENYMHFRKRLLELGS